MFSITPTQCNFNVVIWHHGPSGIDMATQRSDVHCHVTLSCDYLALQESLVWVDVQWVCFYLAWCTIWYGYMGELGWMFSRYTVILYDVPSGMGTWVDVQWVYCQLAWCTIWLWYMVHGQLYMGGCLVGIQSSGMM